MVELKTILDITLVRNILEENGNNENDILKYSTTELNIY